MLRVNTINAALAGLARSTRRKRRLNSIVALATSLLG